MNMSFISTAQLHRVTNRTQLFELTQIEAICYDQSCPMLCLKSSNFMWHYIILLHIDTVGSQDSVVDIATGSGLDGRRVGIRVPLGWRILSSPRRPDRHWPPPPPSVQWAPRALSPGVKPQGREADNAAVPRSRKCGPISPLPRKRPRTSA
jgi:hypothetical protein